MNKKTDLQLQLQKTVEGLSTIVLTYYSTGILKHILLAMNWTSHDINLMAGISIFPIGMSFYIITKKISRKHV